MLINKISFYPYCMHWGCPPPTHQQILGLDQLRGSNSNAGDLYQTGYIQYLTLNDWKCHRWPLRLFSFWINSCQWTNCPCINSTGEDLKKIFVTSVLLFNMFFTGVEEEVTIIPHTDWLQHCRYNPYIIFPLLTLPSWWLTRDQFCIGQE